MCLGRIVPELTHCYETLSLQFNEMFSSVIMYVCTFHPFNKFLSLFVRENLWTIHLSLCKIAGVSD